MRFHGVNLLLHVVKLDGFGVLVAVGAGLIVLVCMLHRAFLGVLFQDFTLFRRVPGTMQQACIFCTSRHITQMSCIISLVLFSAALLGVGWRGGCSSLFIYARTETVGFCPLIIFEGAPPSYIVSAISMR